MKLKLLLFAFTPLFGTLYAQTFNHKNLEVNNLKVSIQSNGEMHRDSNLFLASEIPLNNTNSTIYAQSLWIGGVDNNSELRLAGNTYRQTGNDFWPGPIANSYDAIYDEQYDHVWHLKKTDIENHIINYNTTGYVTPTSIESWPANGNTSNGEAENLAPYADINSNNIYEPSLGDYPLIRGDEALYAIFNDDRTIHTETGGQKIMAEVHQMLYAYDTPSSFNNNVVYSHYTIYNRSQSYSFPNFYVSTWLDLQNLEFSGTHVPKNLIYSYDTLPNTIYGPNAPTTGIVSLNHTLTHSMLYQNSFDGLSGNPSIATDFYNYMNANWKNGASLTNNGNQTSYIYPGDSDTINNASWFNYNASSNLADRRMVGTSSFINFGPGDKLCIDNAIVFAYDSTLTGLDQLNHLFNTTDQVQDFYDTQYDNCEDVSDLSIYETVDLNNQNLSIYQNNHTITVSLKQAAQADIRLNITDVLGRNIKQQILNKGEVSVDINLENTTPGTYFVQCSDKAFSRSIQVVIF